MGLWVFRLAGVRPGFLFRRGLELLGLSSHTIQAGWLCSGTFPGSVKPRVWGPPLLRPPGKRSCTLSFCKCIKTETGLTFCTVQELLEPDSLDLWQTPRADLLMKQVFRFGLKVPEGWHLVPQRVASWHQTPDAGCPLQLCFALQSST